MIVLRTPKGWTGPKMVDGLPVGGHLPLAPGAARRGADQPRASRAARGVDALLPAARSCSTRTARCDSELAALAPTGERRMSANPHANGGLLLRDARAARLPRLRRRRSQRPAATHSEATRVLGDVPARRDRAPTPTASASSAPTRPPPTGCPPCSRRPTAPGTPSCLEGDDHLAPRRPRDGGALSEHLCQGWLEGYLLTGRHGLFNCYEAFIHIVDSMFNQHAKWLKVTREIPWRRADRLAQLPALLARLAPGPQRLLPPGPRLHRPRRQQEGGDRPRLPAAGRQQPAVGGRPLPAQPRLRQRDRRRQAAGARLPDDGRGDRPLHARDRHLGVGRRATGARRARRRARLRRRRADARDARRPPRSCASDCPSSRCASSTSST